MRSNHSIATYTTRRNQFVSDLETKSSTTLKEQLKHCVLVTDLCMITFQDFAASLKASVDFLKKEGDAFRETQHRFQSSMAALKSITLDAPSESVVEYQRNLATQIAAGQNHTLQQSAALNYVYATTIETSASLVLDTLFERIFKSDENHFATKAVLQLANLLADLTVIGPVKGALQNLIAVLRSRNERAKVADDYCDFLEDYLFATYKWCIIAEMLGFKFRHLNDDSTISEEQASFVVQE